MVNRRGFMAATMGLPMLGALPAFAQGQPSGLPQSDEVLRFIQGMPKAEYHVHLEGTLEAEMKFRLAERNGVHLPYANAAQLRESYKYHDLPSFLAIYYDGMKVLQKEQDFHDLAYAYLAKAASQNVLYAEMFFDPQEHVKLGVAIEDVIGGITRAREDAEAKLGIRSQLILCIVRDLPADTAMAVLDAALPMKQYLVGLGLDSDEKDNPPIKFAAHFAKAKAAGLRTTAHCDANQENTLDHLRQVIVEMELDRVDHGVNVVQSPELMAEARKRNIPFTVCPSFSGQVRGASGPIDAVRAMLDNGLKISINSDDPAYMASEYITDALARTQVRSALSMEELVRIERNAFDTAWLPLSERAGFQARLDAYVRDWGKS
ncbi:adenosine deaminase [Novosphingobium sp. 1949]|uniref:Adenine deaminase n=1 Tax=Novosphingobium organovorum TaxID=2930092 RepID=A0ABT0B9T7_9SPHN|nr:adenosine deaminase [Novosphingobium organovorum]MCJ2181783.1 adenosine deaminase [Novosphingobium organovorum]